MDIQIIIKFIFKNTVILKVFLKIIEFYLHEKFQNNEFLCFIIIMENNI